MIENKYKNAYTEVSTILENTEPDLLEKVPSSFLKYIEENKNIEYTPSIDLSIPIDSQELLPETEAILSLIYTSYWADEEDKKYFNEKLEINNNEPIDIFSSNSSVNNTDNVVDELLPIPEPNFFKKILNKIINFFKHRE